MPLTIVSVDRLDGFAHVPNVTANRVYQRVNVVHRHLREFGERMDQFIHALHIDELQLVVKSPQVVVV